MGINLGSSEQPTVILTFKGDKVIKETKGFTGGKCVEATKFIDDLLKPTATNVTFKEEYYHRDTKSNDGLLA